jgi:hypothetical protein
VIGAAIMVAKIATGEMGDNATAADKAHHSRGARRRRLANVARAVLTRRAKA